MSNRPLAASSIDALEALFDGARDQRDTLETIRTELRFRDSRRAKALAERVVQALAVLPEAVGPLPGVWGELERQISELERTAIRRSPVIQRPHGEQELAGLPLPFEDARFTAHQGLGSLRGLIAREPDLARNAEALGMALQLSVFELRHATVASFAGFALLMRKLLGEEVAPWLPALFLGAAAAPGVAIARAEIDRALAFRA